MYCNGARWIAMGLLSPGAGGGGCSNPIGPEGDLVYNLDRHVYQYCDGDIWRAVGIGVLGGCTPDPACPNVGDVCSGDGSGGGNPKFAGCICYYDANSADAGSCKPLYVTQADQSAASQWQTATGTNDIATDSIEDGKINDGQVANSTTLPAFKLCKDLSDGGYTDWYLPARMELDLLWRNKAAIGAFTTSDYWSSMEYDTSGAWNQYFGGGNQFNDIKTDIYAVRCVRRDGGADATPDPFSFTDQTGVAISTVIESNIVQISGVDSGTAVSITGDGSPEYRICADGSSDVNCDGSLIQNWTSGAGAIDDAQYLQLRLTSNAANSTMNSAVVTVGTASDQWDVTTVAVNPCAGPLPPVGTVCADGFVYAGLTPDGNVKMYTTPADAGQSKAGRPPFERSRGPSAASSSGRKISKSTVAASFSRGSPSADNSFRRHSTSQNPRCPRIEISQGKSMPTRNHIAALSASFQRCPYCRPCWRA